MTEQQAQQLIDQQAALLVLAQDIKTYAIVCAVFLVMFLAFYLGYKVAYK